MRILRDEQPIKQREPFSFGISTEGRKAMNVFKRTMSGRPAQLFVPVFPHLGASPAPPGTGLCGVPLRSILCAWRRKEREDPPGLTRPSNPLRGLKIALRGDFLASEFCEAKLHLSAAGG
jgi:hypothetical protein